MQHLSHCPNLSCKCGLHRSSRRTQPLLSPYPIDCQVWAAYSPVKNSPADAAAKAAGGNPSHSATTGELDMYMTNCKVRKNVCYKLCL